MIQLKHDFGRKLICTVAMTLLAATLGASCRAQTTALTRAAFPDGSRRSWTHDIFQGLPDYAWWTAASEAKGDPHYYDELYPLELVRYGSTNGYTEDLQRINPAQQIKNAGFNGWLRLQFSGDSGDLSDALTNADAVGGVSVAPCLDAMTEDDAVRILTKYASVAATHASAARLTDNGVSKLIVFNFSTPCMNATGTNSWSNVRSRLTAAGIPVFFVADCSPVSWALNGQFNAYFPVFDAFYAFDSWSDSKGEQSANWNPFISLINTNNQRLAGGIMPGYDRASDRNGGWVDPERTLLYRRMWQKVLDSGCQWNVINTWGDTEERSEVRPDSAWNWTRADLTAWYNAKLGASPLPTRLAGKSNLYVTAPQWVKEGETPVAEALCLNDTTNTLTTQIQFFGNNSTSATWGASASATVGAHATGAATTSVGAVLASNRPSGRYLRARARLYNGTTLLSEVWSAPVCIYPASQTMPQVAYDGNKTRIRCYSIPAYKALPGTVSLSLSGIPGSTTSATATVSPPSGTTVRFAEVLQNTLQVKNFFGDANRTTSVPKALSPYAEHNTDAFGFYVGRVIDENERVGFSAPIYVAPPAGANAHTTQTPTTTGANDGVSYELGMKFQSDKAGQITALRFWKDAQETGTHTGHLWSASGNLLATVTFSNESASGWQQQPLSSPVSLSANTTYVVSVNTGGGYYVDTPGGLSSSVTNGDLSSVADGNNGVFGSPGAFPTSSYNNSDYFRDVVFVPTVAPLTVHTTQVPATTGASDGVGYELGMKFQSSTVGQVTALRFWKDAQETGTHIGHLWDANGNLLASVTFTGETASGWQQQALTVPVGLAANTTYVVSVNTGGTFFVSSTGGLGSSLTNGALSSIADGNNGVYGSSGAFPTNSYSGSDYFRDLLFAPGS